MNKTAVILLLAIAAVALVALPPTVDAVDCIPMEGCASPHNGVCYSYENGACPKKQPAQQWYCNDMGSELCCCAWIVTPSYLADKAKGAAVKA
eukprot:Nk52_evm33s1485 gene=Nk52_evmTU33s1485